jgi:hypothetical protein
MMQEAHYLFLQESKSKMIKETVIVEYNGFRADRKN